MRIPQTKQLWLPIVIGLLFFFSDVEITRGVEPFVELRDFTFITPVPVNQWKFHQDDAAVAFKPDFNDSKWLVADPNYNWGVNPICWFRKVVTIPQEMAGKAVWMNIIVDDMGVVYVDGRLRHHFNWYGKVFLTPKAAGGDKFFIAVKGLNNQGSGHLVNTELMATADTLRYEIDEKMEYLKPLTRIHWVPVNQWRYFFGEYDGATDPELDDSNWDLVDVLHRWEVENSSCWLRKRVVLPEQINGFDISGSSVTLSLSMDDSAKIYLNGKLQQGQGGRSSSLLLSQNAQSGDEFFLAVKGMNAKRSGVLLDARLTFSKLQPLSEQAVAYLREISSLTMLLERIPQPDPQWGKTMIGSLADALKWPSANGLQACRELLAKAEGELAPVKKAAVEYPIQIKGPYLQNVTQNSITVMWETDSPSDSRVNFGTSDNLDLSVYSSDKTTIHEVTLVNLQPETRYHYRAISGKLSSTLNIFHTAVKKDTPFRFVIWGDSHTNAPQFEKNINRMILYKPDLAISVGDMVLTGSNYDHWGYEFFIPGRNLFKSTPLFTTLGNHEYGGYGAGNPVTWFEKFFSLPGKEYYYSYNYGNSHFIHLNPHTNSPFGVLPGSEQYKWLISDLESDQSKNAAWRFVFFHEPAIGEPLMAEHIVPLLEKYDVTMEFSGHHHTYARHQKPMPDGPFYIITGGGGGSLSDGSRSAERGERNDPKMDVYKAVHHFCLIDINGGTLTFQAIDIDGNVIDTLKFKK